MATPENSRMIRRIATWLQEQARRDALVYAIAAGFAALGAVIVTVALFYVVGIVAQVITPGIVGWWGPVMATVLMMGGLWVWHLKFDRPIEQIIKVKSPRGRVRLRITTLTGASWLMYLDRVNESSVLGSRFFVNCLLLAPRLTTLSWRMGTLAWESPRRDFDTLAATVARLMEGGRISIRNLLAEFPEADPQRFVGELVSLEGVVFLPGEELRGEEPGLTLTPSFPEEFDNWRRERSRRRRAAEY